MRFYESLFWHVTYIGRGTHSCIQVKQSQLRIQQSSKKPNVINCVCSVISNLCSHVQIRILASNYRAKVNWKECGRKCSCFKFRY
jgi:hypothetical protein